MNDQLKNKIYLNLVPNLNKKAGDNQPVMVAPNSPKAPEGKNWKMNVNINGEWYDYCAFDGTDIEGNTSSGRSGNQWNGGGVWHRNRTINPYNHFQQYLIKEAMSMSW